jgi:predicted nucleic acid-binding protein
MKTTIDVADPVLAEAKATAAREGITLRELVESALRHELATHATRKPLKLRDASFMGNRPHAGVPGQEHAGDHRLDLRGPGRLIALEQLDVWRESPVIEMLAEREAFGTLFTIEVRDARVTRPRIHDARIAAICFEHGVRALWTADRDFSRFPALRTRNPLIAPPSDS